MHTEKKSPEVNIQDIDYKWEPWPAQHWRAWGSWFSWGSPIGLGLFLISIGVFIWLLKEAGLVG